MELQYIHKGDKRPLQYVTNHGNVYLNEGDVITIRGKYVYKSDVFNFENGRHRHMCYVQNLIPWLRYWYIVEDTDRVSFIEKMLNGEYMTQLEDDIDCINQIASSLPERDLIIAHYQSTTNYRPTSSYTFKDGLYNGMNISNKPAVDLAWCMYRGLFRLLPEGIVEVDCNEFEKLDSLYIRK